MSRREAGLPERIERSWYAGAPWPALVPPALLYRAVVALRRGLYARRLLPVRRLPVPVLVVGNVTAGGSGKTPLVAWIVSRARALGLSAGIVSRGYGGQRQAAPVRVLADSDPARVGDEPVLLARQTGAPVCVCTRRVDAAASLAGEVDLVVADDGLQHYALGRDLEIAVVDARRGLGNAWLLPAGPLREPAARLRTVDLVVRNGERSGMWLEPTGLKTVRAPEVAAPLAHLAAEAKEGLVAVAGIGDPDRFFDQVRALAPGMALETRAFPDHWRYRPSDLADVRSRRVVMTAKDAVKCAPFAGQHWWSLEVTARLAPGPRAALDRWLGSIGGASK